MEQHQSQFDAAMQAKAADVPNARLAVPFFGVKDIDASLRFYVQGLGFSIVRSWSPEGRIRWCWLELGPVAVMLQEYVEDGHAGNAPPLSPGQGVCICVMCADAIAIYHGAKANGLKPATPFVGNHLWVTSLVDPDGYRLDFESPTDVPEDTVYSGGLSAKADTEIGAAGRRQPDAPGCPISAVRDRSDRGS